MTRLTNKTIFITGASSGLGKATAIKLISEGATVFGVARTESALQELQQQLGEKFHFTLCDIANPEDCQKAITSCIAQLGKLDALINIAGKHNFRHTTEIQQTDWELDLATNLSGPFYLCQAAIPELLKSHGNIINVSSIAGITGQPYSAGYCSAKHGLIGLTKALAMEFMKQDLRVNAICPGGMDTPQVQNIQPPEDCDFDLLMRSAAPRGFMQAEEVANLVAFLASDEASAIHGAVYEVDQGKTVG